MILPPSWTVTICHNIISENFIVFFCSELKPGFAQNHSTFGGPTYMITPCTTLEMMRGKGPLGLALTISGHRDITPSGPGPHHTSLYVVLQDFLWTGSISEVAEALGTWIPTWIKFEASVNPAQPAAGWGRCYKEQFQPQTVLKSWVHLPLPPQLLPISITSKTSSSSFPYIPNPPLLPFQFLRQSYQRGSGTGLKYLGSLGIFQKANQGLE